MLLGGCEKSEKINAITGSTMGTTWTVKTIGSHIISQQVVDARLVTINQIFSTWNAKSELSLFNKKPIQQWIPVSDELFYVLKKSKEIYQQTHGYFDPGIGRLIDIWGFGVNKIEQKPNRHQVQKSLYNSSIRYLMLKGGVNKAIKKTRDIHIDLSAIAKGYAVDEIAKLLNSKNYLVEIGGEVRSRGKHNGKLWMLGIEQPNNPIPIPIKSNNQSIATSGNYRNYFIWEGQRYMHILNPNTGLPANSDLASVSVLHPQTMIADAYATAMMAMGSKKATALAKRLNLSVVLILNQRANFDISKINL
ncbi:FAD:protein FMN transferase (EC 2.7.1.180) [uncultured Gammaproteobacteria bacterium]|nr:FAD:protein FMN transferase (EC 2.7.1.180) [uncultured Gammaproteobacteria bacterium]CAC9555331.1 FAD:protein FMN transferase (EC 2.7.1.180) [uncultured Gammaproteobacteria bacterium]CAC9555545.1 FAD:protein FMN transferase (EC 2.7.1.180) [uncultured Gammaproteobacteria bacterium]CAC9560505.1 FAD:protein FMN transferase (EC 2.7.1.180) [uncultured Gammaproteobacteria bacterium]CAC9562323.1 FAD:protein FMN transferase (EC 2.7.1.180) [uncultured Gammaproteobacteria bacterium]